MTFTKATYHKLIGPDGQPQYGCFSTPFTEINHQDFDYHTTSDRPAKLWQKHFHYKQFQFIGLNSAQYSLACAIANVKYAATAFIYLYDHKTKQLISHSFVQPLGMQCKLSNMPYSGRSYFKKGKNHFDIVALEQQKGYNLEVHLDNIHIDITIQEPEHFQPLSLCTKTGFNGWSYTQKACALQCSGLISWGSKNIAVEAAHFLGNYDWSCGFMRRQTAWNWASFSGFANDTPIGLNLAAGVNETGFTENAFWANGQLHRLPQPLFHYQRHNRLANWVITSENRHIELTFTPGAIHNENIDALIVASNFSQLPGLFNGSITTENGQRFQIKDIPGVVEDHYAKW